MSRTGKKRSSEDTADKNSEFRITSLFLGKAPGVEEEDSRVYNLAEEFAATRANRSSPVYKAVLIFTLILLLFTAWFTYGIQRDIDRISVGITDFEDLNLAELFNKLKKAELELGSIDTRIAMSKKAMQAEIDRMRRENALALKKLEKSGMAEAEKKRIRKTMEAENEKKIKETRKAYEDRIAESEKKAEETMGRMEALKKEAAAEKADYDKTVSLRVKSYKQDADAQIVRLEKNDAELKAMHEAQMAEQKREYEAVLARYEKELKASRDAATRETEKAGDSEQLLDLYKHALTYYAKTSGEHGYVIDPGTKGDMLVVVNPYIAIGKGDRAYILNHENKILAMVELYPAGIRMKAKVLKRMNTGDIQPFDKILLMKN